MYVSMFMKQQKKRHVGNDVGITELRITPVNTWKSYNIILQ